MTAPAIVAVDSYDIRFPTSRELDGSDATNPDPDYCAAHVVRADTGVDGDGFAFTIGRGNEVCRAAIDALAPMVIGRDVSDLGEVARRLTLDSQIRWLGPEKAVVHPAPAALVNAAWDLAGTLAGKPVWRLLAEVGPRGLVDLVDWRYQSDALTPDEAYDMLKTAQRVVFTQLLQADAVDIVQLDACRVGGVNENVAILLLAAKFGVPVCPDAGGVRLCALVQHLAMFDYVAVSGQLADRAIEYVDHLHEHFVDPVRVESGAYQAPLLPGFSAQMRPESLAHHAFPGGAAWRSYT